MAITGRNFVARATTLPWEMQNCGISSGNDLKSSATPTPFLFTLHFSLFSQGRSLIARPLPSNSRLPPSCTGAAAPCLPLRLAKSRPSGGCSHAQRLRALVMREVPRRVVLRAANQNRMIAGGNHTLIYRRERNSLQHSVFSLPPVSFADSPLVRGGLCGAAVIGTTN